jgi:hypothetical protein
MSGLGTNLAYICLFIVFIVILAVNKNDYQYCVKPINIWYMGLLIFFLTHRILMVWAGCISPTGCLWKVLIILLVPVSLLFVFVWNIVGTVFLACISGSETRGKCLANSTIVIDWIFIGVIYLVYFFLFSIFFILFKKIRQDKQNKEKNKKKLKKIYTDILKPASEIGSKRIKEMLKEIDLLIKTSKKSVENLKMFPEEQRVLELFYIPEMKKNPGRVSEIKNSIKKNKNVINMDQNGHEDNSITEPLLQIIGEKQQEKIINQRLSNIQQNANEDSEDCIICCCEMEDSMKKMVLKCKHKYHDTCLFDWLKVKTTCPMCRRNIRIDLLNLITEYLNKLDNALNSNKIEEINSELFIH